MFVRTMLALSLSCIFAGTAIAASTAEQPLTPKKVTNVAVQDPIDPLATEASAATSQISAQEQEDLNQASQTLDSLQQSEDVKADIGAAPATATATTPTSTSPAAKCITGGD